MAKLSQQSRRSNVTNKSNNTNISNINTVVKVKRTRKTVPRDYPPQRSSIYRGVTRHRWTGRYEAHLWDKNCWNESQNKKGRQVYLGAYDDEQAAAHAYDLAALKYWGHETILNFPLLTYQKELKEMEGQSREEYIGSLRRKSSGFSRGVSKYRGVARHHHNGRWEARIGRVFGNKYLYLGTYATQEEAAVAYDMAAIEYRGVNAVTNFDLSRYIKWLRPDANNSTTTDESNLKVETTSLTPTLTPNQINQHINGGTNFLNHHHQQQHQPPPPTVTTSNVMTLSTPPQPTTATSALGLLLQSSKFKEMMEMSTAAQCPIAPVLESEIPRSNFPDDIQTYFESQDLGSYAGGDDFIFGDLSSFMQPMLHGDSALTGIDRF